MTVQALCLRLYGWLYRLCAFLNEVQSLRNNCSHMECVQLLCVVVFSTEHVPNECVLCASCQPVCPEAVDMYRCPGHVRLLFTPCMLLLLLMLGLDLNNGGLCVMVCSEWEERREIYK